MAVSPINAETFVQHVQPLLERNDLPGLMRCVKDRWTCDQIVGLLDHADCDTRKIAALVLGFVGEPGCIGPLATQLRDCDPMLNKMAEHSLWNLWFRCGCKQAKQELVKGSRSMDDRDFDCAISHFSRAIEIAPHFAEAYNQRALAYYLKEEYENSINDCKQVIERMPMHFGAWAGLGHCYALLGHNRLAIDAYRRALDINPHLACVREAVDELNLRLKDA